MEFAYFTMSQIKLQSFIMIPNTLLEVPGLKELSNDAKLLYGILLSRTYLSIENDWRDECGRVYVIYTNEQIQDRMNCANKKAGNILRELEEVGLIERKKQGGQRADIIYVKNYIPIKSGQASALDELSTNSNSTCTNDMSKANITCQTNIPRSVETTSLDMSKGHINYIDQRNNDNSYNHSLIQVSLSGVSKKRATVEDVIEELDYTGKIPYWFKESRDVMRMALEHLCSSEYIHEHGISHAVLKMDSSDAVDTFDLVIDSLIDMTTNDGIQEYRGAKITYAKVIDAINRNIMSSEYETAGMLTDFVFSVIKSFHEASISRPIKSISKYMKVLIWDQLVAGKVKTNADLAYCLHRDGYA